MKKTNFLIVLSLMTLAIFLAFQKPDTVADKTQLTITEGDDGLYELTAKFSKYKNPKVQEAVNESFSPEKIFTTESDRIKNNFILQDGTRFYLKASNGNLNIKFDKSKNSIASYNKMRKLFKLIAEAVK
jgi:hypothetical protein